MGASVLAISTFTLVVGSVTISWSCKEVPLLNKLFRCMNKSFRYSQNLCLGKLQMNMNAVQDVARHIVEVDYRTDATGSKMKH